MASKQILSQGTRLLHDYNAAVIKLFKSSKISTSLSHLLSVTSSHAQGHQFQGHWGQLFLLSKNYVQAKFVIQYK